MYLFQSFFLMKNQPIISEQTDIVSMCHAFKLHLHVNKAMLCYDVFDYAHFCCM